MQIRYEPSGRPYPKGYDEPIFVIRYCGANPQPDISPFVSIDIPPLDNPPLDEVWRIPGASIERETIGDAQVARAPALLAGYVTISQTPDSSLNEISQMMYERIFGLIGKAGYPHLLRVWNSIPRINDEEDGLERYRSFCVGRSAGFADSAVSLSPPPAASAVGSVGSRVQAVFIAAKNPGKHIENPRQISAYNYPPEYGPKSPLFSRATLQTWEETETLFVSGTASVIGHATAHHDDASRQLQATMRNMEILAETASFSMRDLETLKIYLRNPSDLSMVRSRLQSAYGWVSSIYLQADICRANLLIEIEATLTRPRSS
ncbi:MAG: hypothetical protein HQK85_04145 [Nitrospinae bacterium]|nr:hypothetical protein [Nitrospinota bacterium]